jgi:acetyl-CoA carboxylase carboxyl transferase subunit alpha
MGITSDRLMELGLIDTVVPEPLGGAHRDPEAVSHNLKKALLNSIEEVRTLPLEQLLEKRYQQLMAYGDFTENTG